MARNAKKFEKKRGGEMRGNILLLPITGEKRSRTPSDTLPEGKGWQSLQRKGISNKKEENSSPHLTP